MAQHNEDQAAPASVRSFLVADIRGYTAYTAAHGDEAAAKLVEHFAGLVSDGVTAWSGTLVELRGDEALAAFESPRSALRAAVELQTAFADEQRVGTDLPLEVGIGLDAGEAVPVGEGYRGAALNRAARLCSAASARETLASEELIHLAGPVADISYAPPREVSAKGLDEPVAVVAVTAADDAVHEPGPAITLPGPSPIPPQLDPIVPLAGRSVELSWLRWHWRRARHGHARCVVVSGVPGIGKTRLAAAIAAIAHEDGARVTYLPMAKGITEAALAAKADGQPTLLVVDDVDAAPRDLVTATVDEAAALEGPVLLLVIHRTEASAELVRALADLTPASLRRELGPLDLEAVRMIASLYAGDAVDQLPLGDIAEQTGGHPASIHRLSHEWAGRLATQRVGASAGRTESDRRDLQDAESALIADISLLGQAREGGLRYDDRPDLADGGADPSTRTGTCPYKGLEPYAADDAELFFGRERLVAELTARLVGSPFLAIVGASGSGKSSAIGAGLLPSLAGGALPGSESWARVTMRPGEHPLAALTQALCLRFEGLCDEAREPAALLDAAIKTLPQGGRLVLFIDQFEELFASPDAAERTGFIDTICSEHRGLLVIVALRADHYGQAAAYPTLARLLASHHVLVGTLTRSELAAVIERPAEWVGLTVEPELIDALVADAGAEPSVLPLLSTALLEAWTLRDGDDLTLATYQAGGGLHGSVARLAEGVWTSLDPDRQTVARAILLRLAGSGESEGYVRRRVPLTEFDLADDPVVADVLDRLVTARLLTTDDDTVEVTHEALLREWPRLREWLEEDATGHQLHMHLAAAARDWDATGRPAGDLYRGSRLTAAMDWSAEHPEQLNAVERDYLEASAAATEQEVARQRRTNRRLRALVAVVGVLLIAAVGAGVFASLEAGRAEEQAQLAEEQARLAEEQAQLAEDERRVATASALVASSTLEIDSDPSLSKLLALEAASIDPRPDVLTGLHTALAADAVERRVPVADENGEVSWARVDPSGRWMATAGTKPDPRNRMEVFDLGTDTAEPIWTYEAPPGALVSMPRFTPDGTRLVAGVFAHHGSTGPDGTPPPAAGLGIGVWGQPTDAASDWVLDDWIDVGPCGARIEDVSDRNVLAEVPADPEASCFDPTWQQQSPLELVGFDDHVAHRLTDAFEVANPRDLLSADGRTVVFGDARSGQSKVIDTETLEERWTGEFDDAWPLAVSTDGSLLLVEGLTGLEVWDIDGGQAIVSKPHPAGIARGQFQPGGDTVATTGYDATLTVWDARSGQDLGAYPATGSVWPHWFGDRVAVVDDGDSTLLVVDARPTGGPLGIDLCAGAEVRFGETIPNRNLDVADGRALTTFDCGRSFWEGTPSVLLDTSTGDVELSVEGNTGREQAVSPDQRRFARQEDLPQEQVAIRDLESGELVTAMDPVCAHEMEPDPETGCPEGHLFMDWMDWSNDGRLLAGGGHHDGVVVWDTSSGEIVSFVRAQGEGFDPWDSGFSPDGEQLLMSRAKWPESSWVDVYSTETWDLERSVQIDPETADATLGLVGWSPDGSTLYGRGGAETGSGNETLVWIDAETLEKQGPVVRLHDDATMDEALSPDGTRLATGSASGEVRVWDLAERKLVHEVQLENIFPGRSVAGVDWTDDTHVVVVTENGMLAEFTTDADELIRVVSESLTRGFSAGECDRYEIDPCPSLEEMRES